MAIKHSELVQAGLAICVFAAVFVGVSSFAHTYHDALVSIVSAGGPLGIIALTLLQATFTVFFIPLDSSVLVPLATHVWGPLVAACISIVAWTMGSMIAFSIARRYGRPVVERVIGAARVAQAEQHAPHAHLFWWVVFTQAFVQVDFISYMFGLFTPIDLARYTLATALGDILPAFFFSYVGTLPIWYEAAAVVAGMGITALLFWRFTRRAS